MYPEPSGLFLEETDLNNPSEAVNVPSTESKELFSEEAKSVAALNSDLNASQDVQPNNENSSEENVKSSEESMESLESNLAPEPVAEAPAEEIPTPSKKFGVLFINTTSPFAFKPPEAAFSFNISRGREADNEVGDEQNPASENEPSKKFGVLLINTTNPFVFKPASAGLSFNISSGNGGKGKGREGDNKVNAENSDVDESEPNSAESVGPGNEPSKKFGVLLINTTNPFVFKPASAGLSFNISSGNGGKGKGREAALEEAESEETPAIATASIAADENAEAIEVEDKTIPAEETNSVSKPAPAAPVSAPTEKKFGVLLINNTKPHVFKPVSISINKGRQVILKDRLRGASSDEVCAQMCLDQGKETGRVDGEDCICGCYFYVSYFKHFMLLNCRIIEALEA